MPEPSRLRSAFNVCAGGASIIALGVFLYLTFPQTLLGWIGALLCFLSVMYWVWELLSYPSGKAEIPGMLKMLFALLIAGFVLVVAMPFLSGSRAPIVLTVPPPPPPSLQNESKSGSTKTMGRQPQVVPNTSMPSAPVLQPIDIYMKCRNRELPTKIQEEENIRVIPLVQPWTLPFAMPYYPDPGQWPSDGMMTLSHDLNERHSVDCSIKNHGKINVNELSINFGIIYAKSYQLWVGLGSLDSGETTHVLFVNDCRDFVSIKMQKMGKAKLPGEKDTRDFELQLEPLLDLWQLNGVSFRGGWGQRDCS